MGKVLFHYQHSTDDTNSSIVTGDEWDETIFRNANIGDESDDVEECLR